MAQDLYFPSQFSLAAPAANAFPVTASDTVDLPHYTRGLWVGGAGNLVVDMVGLGENISFNAVPAGTLLPLRVKKVKTATSATLILGVY